MDLNCYIYTLIKRFVTSLSLSLHCLNKQGGLYDDLNAKQSDLGLYLKVFCEIAH